MTPNKKQIDDMLAGRTNAETMWLSQKVKLTNMIRRTKETMLDVTPRNIKLLTELNNHLEKLQDSHYNVTVALQRIRSGWEGEVKQTTIQRMQALASFGISAEDFFNIKEAQNA